MADFELYRGDSKTYRVSVVDEAGLPVDITSNLLRFTIKKDLGDPDSSAIVKKASSGFADGGAMQVSIVGAPANGVFDIYLRPADTYTAKPDKYFYDIQVGIGTRVYTVAYGKYTIKGDVTRTYT